MTNPLDETGRAKAPKYVLSAGLILFLGYLLGLGGCGGSRGGFNPDIPIQADGYIPNDIARQIQSCAAEHRTHLGSTSHNIAFDISFADEGEVDEITLLGSTLHDEGLEACMASALRSLSEDDWPLYRPESDAHSAATPDSRAILGQHELILLTCLENPPCLLSLTLLVGATYITMLLYVHNIKTLPSPAPAPPVALPEPEAPKPEPEPADRSIKTTDPPPPPPPPPSPPRRDTCEEKEPEFIRCDDPKIRWYSFWRESAAFNEIVQKLGKGLRKSATDRRTRRGPCVGRGGFHTNVLRGGASVASIVGCDCCDDVGGKAVLKVRAAYLIKQ